MYEPLAMEVYTGPGGPIALDMSHADWRKEVGKMVLELSQPSWWLICGIIMIMQFYMCIFVQDGLIIMLYYIN